MIGPDYRPYIFYLTLLASIIIRIKKDWSNSKVYLPPRRESSCSGSTFPASVSSIPAGTPLKTRRPGRYRSDPECQSLWSCAPCEDRFRATRAAPPWSAASDTRHLRGSPASAWKNKYLLWDYGSLFSLSRFLIALRSSRGKRASLGESLREKENSRQTRAALSVSELSCLADAFTFYSYIFSNLHLHVQIRQVYRILFRDFLRFYSFVLGACKGKWHFRIM